MAHTFKSLRPSTAPPADRKPPPFGRRTTFVAPERSRRASFAAKAFCAAMILLGLAMLAA